MRVISGPATMLIKDEALLKRIEQFNWVLLALLATGSFVFFSREFALGVLVGGILAIANFYLMKRSLLRALDPQRKGKTRFVYLLKYYLRFAALGLMIALLLIKGWVNPFGMLLGLSIIVLGIALVGVEQARKLFFKGVV
ncbi:MAG: ATP synthase subunit I [Deltaproteobacteria bacterium]|nr:ATP synthase subunit I [Deltaproteobacteria bacterium]